MEFVWALVAAIVIVVAGLCALAYDTLRNRHDSNPYPFPDNPTNSLDDTAVQRRLFTASNTRPHTGSHKPRRSSLLPLAVSALSAGTSLARKARVPRRLPRPLPSLQSKRVRLALLGLGVLAFGTGLAVASLAAQAGPTATNGGSVVIGISRFVGEIAQGGASQTLGDYVLKAASGAGMPDIVLRSSKAQPSTQEQAEGERARMGADFLWWGEIGTSGNLTASLAIDPRFEVGQRQWQQFGDPDLGTLLLPQDAQLRLPARLGTDPLVPLSLALAQLRAGDYAASAKSAFGAQATMDQEGGTGQIARFVEGMARMATGEHDQAVRLFGDIERAGTMPPEVLVDRAVARLQLSDYNGVCADLDRVTADRDASDRTLARAYLVRARADYRLAGALAQAVADLDESTRLDPGYLPTKLDKAEVLYRQAQPDAARAELESLVKRAPYAAPAHRLLALVKLMLGQPEEAQKSLAEAGKIYARWIGELRAEEAQAQATGDTAGARRATEGIVRLNRELAGVHLYDGMAFADIARKESAETFLGGLWRRIRGEPTTYERALAEMDRAARLDPRRPDVPLQMGEVYIRMGDTAKAAESLDKARALDPDAPQPYLALANLQESQGNRAEAAKTLNELLARSPHNYSAYQALYEVYTSVGQTDSANASLQRGLDIAPQTPNDHLWRGKFLRTLGRKEEAAAEFQAATQDGALWEAHLQLGEVLQEQGQRSEALAEFKAVLAIQPNEPSALLDAGRLLVLAGQPGDAEKMFERLTNVASGNVDGHIAYSQLLVSKGELDKAVAEGQRAVRADDKSANAHFFLGNAYQAQENWPAASEQFKAATERDPAQFEAFIRWAESLFREDKYAETMAASQSAIKLRSDDPQPYRWKAEAQIALGDPGGALASLGSALRLRPDYAEALALTSRAYALKGDMVSATDYANRAAQADSHNPAGLLALGEAYLAGGRATDALEAYTAALAVSPQSAQALVGQGRARNALGEKEKALKLFADAIKADEHYTEAHLYAGHTYTEMSRWDEALREYRTAVQMRPRWAVALYYLGRAYLQRKDLQNAQVAFAQASQYSPNLVEAWFGLGIADRDLGRSKEAIDALAHATQLNGNYSEAWLYLGLTYEETGDRASAAGAFAQARDQATDPAIKQQAEQGLGRVR